MSVGTLSRVTTVSYAWFYLPVVSLAYLKNQGALPGWVETNFIPVLIGVTGGALVNHAVNLNIFGPGGPLQNPKHKWTVLYQKYALLLSKHPKVQPDTWDELADRWRNHLDNISASKFKLAKYLIRVFTLVTLGITYTVAKYGTFFLLGATVLTAKINYLGLFLLLGQALFMFRWVFFGRFPTPISEDSAKWIKVPEHRKAPTLDELDEIELKRNPDLIENIPSNLAEFERQMDLGPMKPDDVDYLIPLDNEPDYLIDLDSEDE